MGAWNFANLRVRLILFIILAGLPMFGMTLYTGMEERRLAAAEVQANTLRLVRVIINDPERSVEGAHQLLAGLAQVSQVRTRDAEACKEIFANLIKRYPQYNDIGAVDPEGFAFCGARPFVAPLNASDRSWFKRAMETREFVVGEQQMGRGSPASPSPTRCWTRRATCWPSFSPS